MGYPFDPEIVFKDPERVKRVSFSHREEAAHALSAHFNQKFDAVVVKNWARQVENAVLGKSIASRYQEKYYSVDPETGRRGKGWEEMGRAWSKWKQLQGEQLSSQE